MRCLPLEAVAGYTQLWLIPGSQKIKGDECSDSAIPMVNSLAIWLEWSTVTQEFWVRILVDTKYCPFELLQNAERLSCPTRDVDHR